MKRCKHWVCALTAAVVCAFPVQAFGNDANYDESFESASSIVRLAGGSTWNADPETNTPPPPPDEMPATPVESTEAAESVPAGCDLTEECCCPPERSFIASVEATFFWPQFHRDFLTADVDGGNGVTSFATNSVTGSAEGALLVAPRITLGVQGCKWGFLARYWYASSWATGHTPWDPTSDVAGFTTFDNFRAYTLDLEAQRRFCLGAWDMYAFCGARYAMVDNDRSLQTAAFSDIGGVATVANTSAFASQQFGGTGVTFGLWGLRPICCGSPVKYFFSNRYSILWGNIDADSETMATAFNSDGDLASSVNGALATTQTDLFIAEVQLGLQWDAELKCFPGRAFVRTAVEYQYWDTGNAISTFSESLGLAGDGGAYTSASAGDLLFSLIGLNIGAGIMY